jgi:hypothetical protein
MFPEIDRSFSMNGIPQTFQNQRSALETSLTLSLFFTGLLKKYPEPHVQASCLPEPHFLTENFLNAENPWLTIKLLPDFLGPVSSLFLHNRSLQD